MSANNKPFYVRTDAGEILVQVPDKDSVWGFYLTDGDQSWDGGFGVAREWYPHIDEVPRDARETMDWIIEEA